jgi:hypothetical protein
MNLNRTLTRWLAPGLCLVTLLCALVSGLHHHRPEADHGACVACAAGHSPAISAAATIAPTPRPAPEQAVPASFRATPSPAEFRCVSPRAPPLG